MNFSESPGTMSKIQEFCSDLPFSLSDSEDEETDSDGESCEFYDHYFEFCGFYDTENFIANEMCCACKIKASEK